MKPFEPAWWLPGAHASTIWGKFGRREPHPELRWERVPTPDGDFIELAHLVSTAPISAPRLLILHGLEGGANSHYVRGLMREAVTRQWNATLLLFRTCGPTPNTIARSYHSGETSDTLLVLRKLVHELPTTRIGAVGISLGGNVLCKLLGEEGSRLPHQLRGAVAVSAPFDLAKASRYFGHGFGHVYEQAFLRSLRPKASAKISTYEELSTLKSPDQVRTVWEFDDEFTAPVHGFENAADYYAKSSALQFLGGIQRPTLLLNAQDDPFLPPEVLEDVRSATAANSSITIEFPANGGHVGFVGGRWPWKPFYYGEWRTAEFLKRHLSRSDTGER